jgi:ribonuclease P protein component
VSDLATQDFARSRRILKADEFSSAFRLRPVQRSAHFVLYVRPNQLANARLGVVVAKRFAPRAVTRNTIKRVTREIFRMSLLPAIDCVVRLSTPVNTKTGPATSNSLKKALRVELLRLLAAAQRTPRVAGVASAINPADVVQFGPDALTPPGAAT